MLRIAIVFVAVLLLIFLLGKRSSCGCCSKEENKPKSEK